MPATQEHLVLERMKVVYRCLPLFTFVDRDLPLVLQASLAVYVLRCLAE